MDPALNLTPAQPQPWHDRWGRLWRPAGQPHWARPGLAALLGATAALYLWGLGESGWANAFYSAAAQAGSVNWEAFFFGSSDAGNSITVDKPPASLWLMALSVRLFGLNSWSILVPEALAGVAAVGLLYATVRRWFGPGPGLLAGAVMALTPVAVLMFRFNNPDALLVALLVAAAYATTRAVEVASVRWLALAGALVGIGFLTKMLQAFLVVPAFALAYLWAAPAPLRQRIRHVLLAGGALVAALGWWVAIVELVPASVRPYIGGSQNNSILELTFGYNGLGRITGDETGSVTGGAGPNWGETGLTRLFNSDNGGQISWLLPAALILLAAGLWLTRGAPRKDRTRAAFLLWGGWLLVTVATFSLMAGIFHPYYNVALAPAIGALVGMGTGLLWRRHDRVAMYLLAGVIAVTAWWSSVLLARSEDWLPWLSPTIGVLGLGAALGLILFHSGEGAPRIVTLGLVAAGVGAGIAGPAAYALQTAATPHDGAIPSAGPSVGLTGFGGPRGGRPNGGPNGRSNNGAVQGLPGSLPPSFGGGVPFGSRGNPFGGNGNPFGGGWGPGGGGWGPGGGGRGPGGGGWRPGGSMGGLLGAATPSSDMVAALTRDAERYTWVAATVGSNNAAGYQLATGLPVMPVGGFNGSDPSPTLEQFKEYVAQGRIHYFLGGNGFLANGGSQAAREIASWVSDNFSPGTIDGVTVYDLSGSTGTDYYSPVGPR